MPQSIGAGEFKAKCLSILDEVGSSRQGIVITKRGVPVARLLPVEETTSEPLFGRMAGTIQIRGDIIGPIDEAWDADV